MVVTFEFDNLVPSGESSREADAGHGGLGAGIRHADLFDRGDPIDNFLGHLDFVKVGNAVGDAAFGGLVNGICHCDGGVTEDVGPP